MRGDWSVSLSSTRHCSGMKMQGSNRIRVLVVISNLSVGGAQKQVVLNAKYADKDRYDVSVFCTSTYATSGPGALSKELEQAGVSIELAKRRFRFDLLFIFQLAGLLRLRQVDIVHSHLFAPSLWARLAAFLARTPVVLVTEHGLSLWKNRVHIAIDRILMNCTDMFIAVSDAVRQLRLERERIPADKIVTLYNSVDSDGFLAAGRDVAKIREELGLREYDRVIGFVGRLAPIKGLETLIRAVGMLRDIPNLRLVLVGSGSQKEHLRALSRELGMEGKVLFTGYRSDIPSLLALFEIAVLPSYMEACPTVLLEYMFAGKPVVASRVGGITELVVDGENAFLIPPAQVDVLAGRLRFLLDNPKIGLEMGRSGYEYAVQNFSVRDQVMRLESFYEELLECKGII